MTSTRPRFANTINPSRRPKRDLDTDLESLEENEIKGAVLASETEEELKDNAMTTITEFMEQQKKAMQREPTRPITLRFEESLWQKVEALRGPLSKNDFFKYLVDFYANQHK